MKVCFVLLLESGLSNEIKKQGSSKMRKPCHHAKEYDKT